MKKSVKHSRETILQTISLCGLYTTRLGDARYHTINCILSGMVRDGILIATDRIGNRVYYRKNGDVSNISEAKQVPTSKTMTIPVKHWTRANIYQARREGKISDLRAERLLNILKKAGAQCIAY